jgi:hypothetical protein
MWDNRNTKILKSETIGNKTYMKWCPGNLDKLSSGIILKRCITKVPHCWTSSKIQSKSSRKRENRSPTHLQDHSLSRLGSGTSVKIEIEIYIFRRIYI